MFKLAVFNIQYLNSNQEDFFAFIYLFIFCFKLQERLIKIQCTHINKSYLKFRHVPELSHSVDRSINPASKKTFPHYFLPSTLQIVQFPLFWQFPIFNCFFVAPPNNWWIPITSTFFIFKSSYLLKVTKFFLKIYQFKFLVMPDKHFGL